MNKFNGIVTHQTVSDEDFKKMIQHQLRILINIVMSE